MLIDRQPGHAGQAGRDDAADRRGRRPGREQVVLAYQRYGRGKALAFPVQDSWQWQMDADDPGRGPDAREVLAADAALAGDGVPGPVRVTPSEDRASPGRSVELRVEIRDAAFVAVNDADVVARGDRPRAGGARGSRRVDGRARRRVPRPLRPEAPGFYAVRVEASRHGDGRWARPPPPSRPRRSRTSTSGPSGGRRC